MNIKTLIISGLALSAIFSGCAEVTCKPGSKLDKDKEHCLVTNKPLKGVVQKINCENEDNCTAIVNDERGRLITITANEDTKIGEEVNIYLYEEPVKK